MKRLPRGLLFLSAAAICLIAANPVFSGLRLSETEWNLGKIGKDSVHHLAFKLKNTDDEKLSVRFRPNCDCLMTDLTSLELKKDEIKTLRLTLNSKGLSGEVKKILFIESNDRENPNIFFYITAEILGEEQKNPSPDLRLPPAGGIPSNSGHKGRGMEKPSPLSGRGQGEGEYPEGKVLYLFMDPGCPFCRELLNEKIAGIERKTGSIIQKNILDISENDNFLKLKSIEASLGSEGKEFPVLFINNKLLYGKSGIYAGLEYEISMLGSQKDRFEELCAKPAAEVGLPGLNVVLLAGLADGVNPCAFATIIFFISYLAYAGASKKKLLLTGLSFALAVYVTYFSVGLGFLRVLLLLPAYGRISALVKYLAVTSCFVFAVLSFYDYFQYKKGKAESMVLQLPGYLKLKIHEKIRIFSKKEDNSGNPGRTAGSSSGIIFYSFITGVLISFFEFVCTGQVYLPTIIHIVKSSSGRSAAKGLIYLAFYNFMFIIPLIAVFMAAYFGSSSQKIQDFGREKAGLFKLLLGIVFLVLGWYLL